MKHLKSCVLTSIEVDNIAYVSDFVESNSEYNFPASMSQEIHECMRTKRAPSERAKGLIGSIRAAISSGARRAHEALGYKDDITDMSNPVVQWLVSQAE